MLAGIGRKKLQTGGQGGKGAGVTSVNVSLGGNSHSSPQSDKCTTLTPHQRPLPKEGFVVGKYIVNVCAHGRVD